MNAVHLLAGFLTILAAAGHPLLAQEALSLRQAVDLALRTNPLIAAADAGEKEAAGRIHQAQSGYLPRLQLSESSVATTRCSYSARFSPSTSSVMQIFAIGPLNRPDAMNNYQSRLTVPVVYFIVNRRRSQ